MRSYVIFDFRVEVPSVPVGKGRRAENKVRHEHSNYDAMLKSAGGLLYPEIYETVRRGVDAIVADEMRRAQS
jgi:hypothetical protein